MFFFSPYFSTPEKVEGLDKVVTGAEPILQNFLKLLIEKSRMPAVFRVRRVFDELWQRENKLLPVEITSAIELDKKTVKQIGDRIGEETGQKIELSEQRRPGHPRRAHRPRRQLDHRRVDPRPPRPTSQTGRQGLIGDSSLTMPMQIKPDEITSILKSRIEGLDEGQRRPHRGRHRPLGRRRHRARPRPRELRGARDARAAPRRDRPRALARVRQRRRGAVRRVGPHRRGRHRQAHRQAARDPRRRGPARPHRRPARQPARRQGRHRDRPDAARPSSRPPASSSASR